VSTSTDGGTTPTTSAIDLHTHSSASDGLYPPAELVALAEKSHLRAIGLADHDTTNGLAAAMSAGASLGVEVIPAVEVNTDLPGSREEVHVLGYFIDYLQPELQASLRFLREARARRGERMVEKLRQQGINITWERVRQLAEGSVGRPHVARALIEAGYATDVSDAFDKWVGRGRPGYIPRYKLASDDAVRLVRSAYGVPALAHPAGILRGVYDAEAKVISPLVAAGMQGLECYYGDYDDPTVSQLLDLAGRYRLIPTGGSDYHGPNMHPTPLGGRFVPEVCLEQLRLQAAENRRHPAERFVLPPAPDPS
jgi:predicted metal-dependent phosphoesterase TrpH